MKIEIKVFPDFMSTGLWDYAGRNMCQSRVAHVIPEHMLIALKYWHSTWEACFDRHYNSTMSEKYAKEWAADGQAIVDAMNACQNEFTFIYTPF